jgi:hypothetical protein
MSDNKQYLLQDDENGVKCENCNHEFNLTEQPEDDMGHVNCPSCGEPIKQGDEIGEEERKTVTQYDFNKSGDIEKFNKDLDNADPEKVTVGDDGAQIEESNIITSDDFNKLVENYGKTNLSEREIMSILFESESPRMTKSELIEEISNQIINEADMDDSVRRKFESGESDYSEHLDADSVRRISQEVFGDVQMLLGQSLMEAIQKEQRIGIPYLQDKAVSMIREQFNIPEDAVDFQAEITGLPQMGGRPIVKGDLQYTKGDRRPPEGKSEEELKPEVTRRRLTNAMMHGAARKSQNLHHMSDELRERDPSLNRDYGNIMAANDAMYWMMSDESIENEGRQGVHAGNVRLDLSNPQKPKIIAQGIVFPILLHELAKGVMELMSLWSLPKDKNERDYVTDKTDHLQAETNDIRLGSYLWGKFIEQIPVDNQDVISLTFNLLQQEPTNEFNSIMSGLSNDSEEAKSKVRELANQAIEELRNEEYDEAIGGYGDEPSEEPEDDINLDDLLGGDETSEEPEGEPDYSTWSQRDLQDVLNTALDNGDYDTLEKIQPYIK